MSVRAKFVCGWKTTNAAGQGDQIYLSPVYSGSEENEKFFAATPGGQIQLFTTNPDAAAQFVQGKEYFVDFTPAT